MAMLGSEHLKIQDVYSQIQPCVYPFAPSQTQPTDEYACWLSPQIPSVFCPNTKYIFGL